MSTLRNVTITDIALPALLLAIAAFHAATIRQGHIWGDDFAMYVHHARNIVDGRPYADTGYLFNPASPVSPRMYPPVFPLLLAPIVRFSGLNLIPMKLEQVLFFVLTLMAVYALWRRDLGSTYSLALIAILGFNPHFWEAKDNVLSDLPFLLFFYVAALLVQNAPRDRIGWWRWAILIGIVLYLAIGTRTAGLALVAGLLLFDLLKFRAITRRTIVALSICGCLLLVQSRFIGSGFGNYDGHFHVTFRTLSTHLVFYPRTLVGFWVASTHNAFSFVVLAIVSLLMFAGFFFRSKRGFTIVEAFLIPYGAMAVLWPFSPGIRLVFPFIPWMVFLGLSGLRELAANFVPRDATVVMLGFLLMIVIPYTEAYHDADFGPIRQTTGLAEFNQLCQAVRDETTPQDVLIYFRARALALYTDRTASAYNYQGTDAELLQYANKIHATYLVTTNAFDEDHKFLALWAANHSSDLELTYQNVNFKLYRILTTAGSLNAQNGVSP